jgi:MFS family permease
LPGLGVTTLVTQAAAGGASLVLLPNQMALIDETHKVANLAMVTSVSFAVAILAQPLTGALSDRTRSRLGRRAPWMLAGAGASAVALAAIGHIGAIPGIMACWICWQLSLAVAGAPMTAVMPDRVPEAKRGAASAFIGLGWMVGAGLGTVAAGRLAGSLPGGYTALGLVVLAGIVGFVLFNRDRTTTAAAPERFKLGGFLRSFWINPVKHPDYAWAFAARFLFVISYFAIVTFTLYILTDFVGMTPAEANLKIGLVNGVSIVAACVAITVGGFVSDAIARRKPFIYAASVFMAVGLVAPLIWHTFAAVLVLAAGFGLGFGLYQACDYVLMTLVLPNSGAAAGKDLGILNLATAIPNALAPALGGWVVLHAGGYPGLFVAGIIMCSLAGLALIPILGVK